MQRTEQPDPVRTSERGRNDRGTNICEGESVCVCLAHFQPRFNEPDNESHPLTPRVFCFVLGVDSNQLIEKIGVRE